MNSLARVLPHHVEPADVELQDDCPRCGRSLDRALREVNLVLRQDRGPDRHHGRDRADRRPRQ
jgi:hypothetical protein